MLSAGYQLLVDLYDISGQQGTEHRALAYSAMPMQSRIKPSNMIRY